MPEEIQNPVDQIPQEIQDALRDLHEKCRKENTFIRYAQVRAWKKAEEFWHGVQFIYWSEIAHEWRTPDNLVETSEKSRDNAGPFYDYVINIYKAHGESVIAALSQEIPVVEFFPDDADESDDLSTAKTKTQIGILIQKHNRSKLLLMEALHKLFNAGLVASYIYPKSDNDFGTRQVPVYGKEPFDVNYQDCPICGARLGEYNPEMPTTLCPTCGSEVSPNIVTEQEERTVQTGVQDVPKSRTLIEVYGPLNVKVPYYARNQKECGYLLRFIEQHFGLVRETYPWIRDAIKADYSIGDTDRWTRTPSSFASAPHGIDDITSLTTVEKLWLRPWMFESMDDVGLAASLKTLYPQGCRVVFVNDKIAEVLEENLDDYWEIGKAGPSTYIHSDGMGNSLIPVQEMRNVLVNLGIETIEHGIPTGFADPDVLDFDEYSNTEVAPGSIYPAKPKPNQKIGDAFYEQKTATLSKEVQPFKESLDQDGQFVSGDLPSIFGGSTPASSRTAREYGMQQSQALKRLTIAWEYIRLWWAGTINKAVNCFIKNLVEDERYVREDAGVYTNIMIRRADLLGKANVEPQASEHFPMGALQKKQVIMELMQLQIPEIQAVVAHPENVDQIAEALGFPELYIPGEDQRFKQLVEINELQKVDETITPEMFPTVPTEPEIDDEEAHVQVCKIYLASERGQNLKKINPLAYQNIKEHCILHQLSLEEKMMTQIENNPVGEPAETTAEGTTV